MVVVVELVVVLLVVVVDDVVVAAIVVVGAAVVTGATVDVTAEPLPPEPQAPRKATVTSPADTRFVVVRSEFSFIP